MMANSSNLNTHSVLGYFQPSLTGLVGLVLKPRISSWARFSRPRSTSSGQALTGLKENSPFETASVVLRGLGYYAL
jgi:hypothetical protein